MRTDDRYYKSKQSRNIKLLIRGAFALILIILLGLTWYQANKKPKVLLVAAAASMKASMEEILEEYRKQHTDIKILVTYAGSGTLEQQIRQGAPIDLFLSAAASNMDSLSQDGLIIDSSRVNLMQNKLVLIEPTGSELKLSGFEELVWAGKIAIGDPDSVPAGKYAYETCKYLSIWEELEGRLIYGKDVTEVLSWVSSGNADAGMVYSTDASLTDQVRIVAIAPNGSHGRIIYCAAVVDGTKEERAGREFIKYLSSEKAKQVFYKYGFLPVE